MLPKYTDDDLRRERRIRLTAERLLEQKEQELAAANKKLSAHALSLSDQIVDQRKVVRELEGQNNKVIADLKIANHKAVTVERLLWDAVETIQDGFALFDANLTLIAANPPYLRVFSGIDEVAPGVNLATILDLCVDEGIVDLQGRDPDEWHHFMIERLSAETIEPVTLHFWNGIYTKMMDRRTDDGGIVSMAINITDTIIREEELRHARDKAEAADRAKSAFLAKMSHELRTPMNGVVGMAELLLENELDEESTLYANTIKNSGSALLDIINDILDFSKIEAEKLELKPEAFDLEQLVQDVGLIVAPSVQQKKIDFQIDYDQFLPAAFYGDPGRIRQVFTNLIGNAVKFTDEGYVLVRVVGLTTEDEESCQLHITIEDSGLGIDEKMAEHIFGEFNQIEDEANRKYEGTGLGLAITRKLVEQMGGEVWVSSLKGEGSCFGFSITLPIVTEANKPVNVLPENLGPILVMEPNSLDKEVLMRQLSLLGTTTIPASNAGDALTKLANQKFHAAFLGHPWDQEEVDTFLSGLSTLPDQVPVIHLFPAHRKPTLPAQALALEKPFHRQDLFDILMEFHAQEPLVRKLRVLAAEDNKTNQLVFKKMLKGIDMDLTMVNNGREAVESYTADQFDLVFMDISMPEMDGMEASRAIRVHEAEQGLDRVPIVAMTAHAMKGDEERICAAGVDHHLSKPLSKGKVHDIIRTLAPPDTAPFADIDRDAQSQATSGHLQNVVA